MGQLTAADFQAYPNTVDGDDAVTAGPLALYYVPVSQILPTQMNEGLTEVGKKAAGFDLLQSSQLQANLLTDVEPVVIGPDGQLYLLDGHHTFTALDEFDLWIERPVRLRRRCRQLFQSFGIRILRDDAAKQFAAALE